MALFSEQSFRNFVDSVMMFGATMEPRKDRVVIRVSRALERRRSLAWLVATILCHGVNMQQCDTSNEDVVIYRTEPLMFARAEYRRWYGERSLTSSSNGSGGARAPLDLEVTLPLLVAWSVASLSETDASSEIVRYKMPGSSSNPLLVDRVVREANAMGVALRCNSGGIFVPGDERDKIGADIVPYVPRAAWDVAAEVEVA